MTREEVLERLQNTIKEGRAIIGTGSGIGLAAVCAENGGVDLIGTKKPAASAPLLAAAAGR